MQLAAGAARKYSISCTRVGSIQPARPWQCALPPRAGAGTPRNWVARDVLSSSRPRYGGGGFRSSIDGVVRFEKFARGGGCGEGTRERIFGATHETNAGAGAGAALVCRTSRRAVLYRDTIHTPASWYSQPTWTGRWIWTWTWCVHFKLNCPPRCTSALFAVQIVLARPWPILTLYQLAFSESVLC